MNRKFRTRRAKASYGKLENRNLFAADIVTTCLATEQVGASMSFANAEVIQNDAILSQTKFADRMTPPGRIVNDPVSVTDIVLGNGTDSRSIVDQLTLAFDGIVDPLEGALVLVQRDSGMHVDLDWTIDNSSGVSVLTIVFSGELTESNGSLVDGNYELRVDGDLLGSDSSGNDFLYGNQETDNFFRFFGDTDGSRRVDVRNLLAIRKTYLHSESEPEFNAQLDSNGDGRVDVRDLLSFRRNYGETLEFV